MEPFPRVTLSRYFEILPQHARFTCPIVLMCEPSASASHGGVHILLILVNEAFSLTTLLSVVLGFCLFVFYWLSSQERADLALFHTLSCTFWSSVMYIQGSEFLFLLLEVPYCLFIHTELGQQHHNS